MEEVEDDFQSVDDLSYDASYQACYIFRSTYKREDGVVSRPNKKQRLNGIPKTAPKAKPLSLDLRKQTFQDAWASKHYQDGQTNVDQHALDELTSYIQSKPSRPTSDRIPSALIMSGVDEANYSSLLKSIQRMLGTSGTYDRSGSALLDGSQPPSREGSPNYVFIELKAQQCTSLQIALKNLVKQTITDAAGSEAFQEFLINRKKLLPLNFDLDILDEFCQQHDNLQIVLSLSDVETMSNHIIGDLISTLHSWQDRIPLLVLFGIASTRDLFEQRLSRSCLRLLDAKEFRFMAMSKGHDGLPQGFEMESDSSVSLTYDHTILQAINDICHVQGHSSRLLHQILKLIYLSHYMVNPISDCAGGMEFGEDEIRAVAKAIRRTNSFKLYCTDLLQLRGANGDMKVRGLLECDRQLLEEVKSQVQRGQERYSGVLSLVRFLTDLYVASHKYHTVNGPPRMEIEARIVRSLPNLVECPVYLDILDKLKDLQPRGILALLDQIHHRPTTVRLEHTNYIRDTGALNGQTISSGNSSRSKKKRLSAEVSELSSGKSALNADTRVLDKDLFLEYLEHMMAEHSLDTSRLLLHEAYILSNRTVRLKQYFEPNPRSAIERALDEPGDYLGCGCCSKLTEDEQDDMSLYGSKDDQGDSGTKPVASILFGLLQEAPTIINVRDLYDAFESRIQESQTTATPEGQTNSTTVMMLFYRALSELKMLGLVKESAGTQVKRKAKSSKSAAQDADFVAKTSWAGL